MKSGVVRLDQIMSISLTMNKYGWQFCFAHVEHNSINLELYYN